MPNPLTGDFDAVLQVSGFAINGLMATIHENSFTKPDSPSFPHHASFRIGDDGDYLWGHRGWIQAQFGVPLVELINGSTNTFRIEVGVRARYRGDAGSEPLPEFIHGTVTAMYELVDIDKNCFGWRKLADEYVWVRVVADSVEFAGTAAYDSELTGIEGLVYAAAGGDETWKVTRLVGALLATRFEANPQKMDSRFRRGSMRSLNDGSGSAVVIPISTDGSAPVGNIASVNQIHTYANHVAAAISGEYIRAAVDAELEPLRSFRTGFSFYNKEVRVVTVNETDIRWDVRVRSVDASWAGDFGVMGPVGVGCVVVRVIVDVTATYAYLYGVSNLLPNDFNLTAEVTAVLAVTFDEAQRQLSIALFGSPKVDIHGRYAGFVTAADKSKVVNAVNTLAPTVAIPLAPYTAELQKGLQKLDPGAGIHLSSAEFLDDGIVLRGSIAYSNPVTPTASFVKTYEDDGFSALSSWIPGGRVDRFEWSWAWTGGHPAGGSRQLDDRFILRRPRAKSGKFGVTLGGESLPGLDGPGRVCLTITGVRFDKDVGKLVPVQSTRECTRFGRWISFDLASRHLRWRDEPELSQDVPFPQLALRAVHGAAAAGANTLLVYAGREWSEQVTETLRAALDTVERDDAGLAVLVLFAEGVLTTDRAKMISRELSELNRDHGVAIHVNEDVGRQWSQRLAIDVDSGEPAWRLMNPRGAVTWMHNGQAEREHLADGLEQCLLASGPSLVAPVVSGPRVGDRFDASRIGVDVLALGPEPSRCPPSPYGWSKADLLFVGIDDVASAVAAHTQRRPLFDEHVTTLVVVDGVDTAAAQTLLEDVAAAFDVIGDPDGAFARQLGVQVWPTAVSLHDRGAVGCVVVGIPVPDGSDLDAGSADDEPSAESAR